MASLTQTPSIRRRLWNLAAPVVGLNLLGVLSLAVDTAMCSRLPDAEVALEALGYAGQLVFLSTVVMMGLSVGAVALVARAYGAGEHGRVGHVLRQSTQLTVLVSLVVAVFGTFGAGELVRLIGGRGVVVDVAVDYLRPLFACSVFYFLSILYAAVLRGVRQTLLPFVVSFGANVVNVTLNYAFIFGNWGAPRLGVTGAAVSTVASQALGVVVLVVLLRRGVVPGFEVRLAPRRVDPPLVRELVRVGAPAALDMLILNVSFLSLVFMLSLLDGVAVAAHGVGLRVQSLAFVPGLGIAQATGAMVGNALGAGRAEEARAVARAAVAMASGVMTVLGLVLVLGAEWVVTVPFATAPGTGLHGYSVTWMRVLALQMPVVGVHIALVGVLRGAGATRTSLSINFFGTVFIQLPACLLLGFAAGLGPLGVWAGLPLSYVAKMTMSALAYRRGEWAREGLEA